MIGNIVAYDLTNAPDLRQTPSNIFAVFHFHVEQMDPDPRDPNALLFPRIHYVNVFHGERVYNPNVADPTNPLEWRVDGWEQHGTGARNARAEILDCPPGAYWWPGADAGRSNQATGNEQIIEDLGSVLRFQGSFLIFKHRSSTLQKDYLLVSRDFTSGELPKLGKIVATMPKSMLPSLVG